MTHPAPLAGALLWMCGALSSFAAMAIAGRELSNELSVPQLLLLRSAIGVVIISALITQYNKALFQTSVPALHMIRNSAHFVGQYGWFYGIASLPLANVFALEFTTPIWCLLLAPLLVGENITRPRVIAVLLGFIGIIIILRPGIEVIDPAALAVLGAAVGFAIAYLITKKMSSQSHNPQAPLTILFYMCLTQLGLSLWPATSNWHPLAQHHLLPVLAVSLTALSAHYCLTRALKLADASIIVPIDFMRLPLIAVSGLVLYNEAVDMWVIAGAAIMLSGNYFNIHTEQRRLKALQANEKTN